MAGEYHQFAAAMCTISVFHMKSVLNVVSRHFGVAFNIPRHNVGIYASKLISYRFFLGMVGSAFELILHKIVTRVCNQVHAGIANEIADAITQAGNTGATNAEDLKKKASELAKDIVENNATTIAGAFALLPITAGQATQIVEKIVAGIIVDNAGELAGGSGSAGKVAEDAIKTAVQNQVKTKQDDIIREIANEFRKGVSMISFIWMIMCRVVFLRMLYKSTNLGYHAYTILNVEGLSWGVVQMTLFPLTPKHSSVTTMSIDVSTMTIFFFQLALDAFLFHRPLYMIKIEMWIIVFWNVAAIPIWACSIYRVVEDPSGFGDCQGKDGGLTALWSPFWMFFFVSLLKDYMFPGVIPYALLTPDQAHLTNIAFPPFYIMGSLLVIILDGFGGTWKHTACESFKNWENPYNAFWLLYIPQVVNYAFAHVAIHTSGRVSKYILGNRGFVLFMALVMQLGYSILESLSFVCVANYTFGNTENKKNTAYLEAHNLLAEVYRFVFSKTSVGYNNLRNRYGLGMNVVHPHRLRPPGAGYWIGQSCKIAWLDTKNDLRMNIGDYL